MAYRSIAILATIAALLSLYMTITSLLGSQPLGCGAGMLDCESVLATRWSTWFGVPISAIGFAIYSTLAGLAIGSMFELPEQVKSMTRKLLIGGTAIAAVSALWFIALQGAVLGKFCLYCTVIHVCGLGTAVIAAIWLSLSLREVLVSLIVGLIAGAIVFSGQATSLNEVPTKTPYVVAVDLDLQLIKPIVMPWPEESTPDTSQYHSLLGGQLRLQPNSRPTLGDPKAPQVALKLFDYTCGYCRRLHGQLEEVLAANPERYCFVLIHLPLSPECNPYADDETDRHADACELSRLALAVWAVDPESFLEFNRWLCAGEEARNVVDARAEAISLIGEEQLEAALTDPQVDRVLTENVELYSLEEIPLLPSLLTKRRIISGSFVDSDQLAEVLGEE